MSRFVVIVFGMLLFFGYMPYRVHAQQVAPSAESRIRAATLRELRNVEAEQRIRAQRWANQRSLPTAIRQRDGRRVLLVGIETHRPVYLTSHNQEAARATSTVFLYPGNPFGPALTGRNLTIGIWDGGIPLDTHRELSGRVTIRDEAAVDDHATHVAGTLVATGIRPEARGMAYEASLTAYDWKDDVAEMATEADRGLLVSNHSYGVIAGWYYGDLEGEGDQWYWLGDPDVSPEEDYLFGWYDVEAGQFDRAVLSNPYLLPVIAAGNDRSDRGPSDGTYRGLDTQGNWQTYAVNAQSHPPDGDLDGFDTIAGAALAKNVLTVGSIRMDGSGRSTASSFSSFGPADDGRIKPDLVGYGERVLSTTASTDASYGIFSGTSMATPNVAGSLALLQQHYYNVTGRYMRAATLKALALHTAEDLGLPGPDYQYGWGLLNAERAAQHLSSVPENESAVQELTLENQIPLTLPVTVAEAGPLRVTICWTDRTSSRLPLRSTASLDDPTPHLRNDLDLRVVNDATGETYFPFVLDVSRPGQPAATGDNTVDPVEQVYLPFADTGTYTIVVSHKNTLVSGDPQTVAVVVSGARSMERPVAVSHLESDASVERVRLTWKTPFERGEGRFLIQRAPVTFQASNNKTIGAFVQVGILETAGTSENIQAYAFEDPHVASGRYHYQVLYDGGDTRYLAASIEALVPLPERLAVLSNYPNPFRNHTHLVFDLPASQYVTLEVYDVMGRRIQPIHEGSLRAGRHEHEIDATGWAAGLYLVRLTTPEATYTHRLVVAR